MSITPAAQPDPIQYAVFNGAGQVVDTAETQTAAFRLIDWYTRNRPMWGPYRTDLALAAEVAR